MVSQLNAIFRYSGELEVRDTDALIRLLPPNYIDEIRQKAEELCESLEFESEDEKNLAIWMFLRGYVYQYMKSDEEVSED